MRTNECQKEESALTAPNQRKPKKKKVTRNGQQKNSNKKLVTVSIYTRSDH